MSERDPKAMMAHAQQLPNSKSVPALHHVGNSGKTTSQFIWLKCQIVEHGFVFIHKCFPLSFWICINVQI